MKLKYSFSIQTGITLIILGLGTIGISLVIASSAIYKQFAHEHQNISISNQVNLKAHDLLHELISLETKLSISIQKTNNFKKLIQYYNIPKIREAIDEHFHRYFQTAGIIKLQKIYVFDKQFNLITHSSEGYPLAEKNQILCSSLIDKARKRKGAEILKTLDQLCLEKGQPFQAILASIGNLRHFGYLLILSDPGFQLKKIEKTLGLPTKIIYGNQTIVHQSPDWTKFGQALNTKEIKYSLFTDTKEKALTIMIEKDQTIFNQKIAQTRNLVVLAAIFIIAIAMFLAIALLKKGLQPLKKLQEAATNVIKGIYVPVKGVASREVAIPIRSFNEMLRQVQEQKDHLEELVENRTKALEIARDQALAANRSKSTFLANMSHELRTPLNAIIGYSELLEEDALDRDDKCGAEDLQKIHNAGRHLLLLINDVLDLSKIEADKITLYNEEFAIKSFIDSIAGFFMPSLQSNLNQLTIHCTEEIGIIYADVTRLRQVLFNLISNANKFTENGHITIQVEKKIKNDNEWCYISVTDTGIGMTPEEQRKVFNEFTQADTSTTRKYGGTGLGLTISKRFCEMMGGNIKLKSELGKGTTFTTYFPLIQEHEETHVHHKNEDSFQQKTILVVDNNPVSRDMLSIFLQQENFEILTAKSSKQALSLAKSTQPDIITLNVRLPDQECWSILQAHKNDAELSAIPIIALNIEEDIEMGYTLGVSEILTKPIEIDLLTQHLMKYKEYAEETYVLIIDDEHDFTECLSRQIKKLNWQCKEAYNGQNALEIMNQSPPSLILLNLMIPVMDGFDFSKIIRSEKQWDNIPIIMMTSIGLTPSEQNVLQSRVTQILQKNTHSHEEIIRHIHSIAMSHK